SSYSLFLEEVAVRKSVPRSGIRGMILCLAMGTVLSGGCSKDAASAPEPSQTEKDLKALARLYGNYIGSHQGRSPSGPEDLRSFIRNLDKQTLSSLQVTDADKLFRGDYVILYNVAATMPMPGQNAAVIVYEKNARSGMRFVAFSHAGVEEVDEDKFKELVPGPK